MYREELIKSCKKLRLSRNLAEQGADIEAESFQENLLKLFNLEIEHRERAKRERLIKTAGFYARKTFEDYRFDEVRLPSGVTPEYLKNVTFVEEVKNLILYGNVGTGKTHMSIALGMEACRRGMKVGFYRTASLVNRLSDAKKTGELTKFLNTINKQDLLILDEWGYVPLDRDAAQLLFQIVSESYERRSVIITTNLEFSRWIGIFYDEQMTAAIIDRLIHHSYLLIFDGSSNRVRDSLMKLEN